MEAYNSLEEIAERPESAYSEKKVLGKKMFQARNRTKELENKLKQVENRIKHLNMEQDRSQKTSKFMAKNDSKLTSVQEAHQKLKQELIDWRLTTDQAIIQKRRETSQLRKSRKESLKLAKEEIVSKNRMSSLCVKANREANLAYIEKYNTTVSSILKNHAKNLAKNIKLIKHTRSATTQQNLNQQEQDYLIKLENEKRQQEEILKKIELLSKTEENLSTKMLNEEKNSYLTCALFSEKSIEKEDNITSIV